jgi:hypothetical protein
MAPVVSPKRFPCLFRLLTLSTSRILLFFLCKSITADMQM